MPPVDMPDVTDDVVNATHGHNPIATGDVVNVLPSHDSSEDQDLGEAGGVVNTNPSQIHLGEAGGVINTNPSQIDLGGAGGVVNTNPSHMSINIEPNILFTRISKSVSLVAK